MTKVTYKIFLCFFGLELWFTMDKFAYEINDATVLEERTFALCLHKIRRMKTNYVTICQVVTWPSNEKPCCISCDHYLGQVSYYVTSGPTLRVIIKTTVWVVQKWNLNQYYTLYYGYLLSWNIEYFRLQCWQIFTNTFIKSNRRETL